MGSTVGVQHAAPLLARAIDYGLLESGGVGKFKICTIMLFSYCP
jgi:hypothetical protein